MHYAIAAVIAVALVIGWLRRFVLRPGGMHGYEACPACGSRTLLTVNFVTATVLIDGKRARLLVLSPMRDLRRTVSASAGWELGPGSCWLRQSERMNSVHPRHSPEHFQEYTHYVLTFHDSTFECIACSFSVSVTTKPLRSLFDEFERLLNATDR